MSRNRKHQGRNLSSNGILQPISLEDKVQINGGPSGYALDFERKFLSNRTPSTKKSKKQMKTPRDAYGRPTQSNECEGYDKIKCVQRSFDRKKVSNNDCILTPAYIHRHSESESNNGCDNTPHNPYINTKSLAPPSSAKFSRHRLSQRHVVCSISENLARETCITTMDATSPVAIEIHKMANGQTYIETLAYLEMIQPHEVLLNEGRRNSQLCRKIVATFNGSLMNKYCDNDDSDTNTSTATKKRRKQFTNQNIGLQTPAVMLSTYSPSFTSTSTSTSARSKEECQSETIVKFLPRSYFDQTRGAELLQNVAHATSYDPSIINEYIVLSSSYSLLSYIQSCLGSNFNRNSLRLIMNWGGKYRLAIDRNTISHLELLANAKTGKSKNSLIGTIDCTKTNVGSRLLRSNLMSPPTGISTINARLDLVDSFLDDEAFFYEVLEQLYAMPDIDKMMAHISLVPNTQRVSLAKHGAFNKPTRQVTARMASKGISALVCIKSILSVIPNFSRVLEIKLKSLDKRDVRTQVQETCRNDNKTTQSTDFVRKSSDDLSCSDDDTELSSSDSNKEIDSVPSESTYKSDGKKRKETETLFSSNSSSLLIGIGGGDPSTLSYGNGKEDKHQLLRAVLMTMKQPALNEILDSVLDIFTESTTFSRNSHAMRHQECFALKPNTDGMMDVLRKAFLANVDDIYKLADQYSQTYGFIVVVKETTARGYYLSIPVAQVSNLPNIFIQPVKSGKFYNCTTEEVHSLNSRAQENVQDLLLMTHERIQDCIENARQKYDALASLSDAIALIDMCHCFADNVASSRQPWCRPTVTDCCLDNISNASGIVGSGAIAIRNGRYAIDISKTGLMVVANDHTNHKFVPNDTYASAFQNFTIITGINGTGKSTYLKQIAIVVILAHCGSYVPAEEAYIPVRDRICTRIGTNDDQEHNISTFMQEMKDTAFICKNATDKSLILIDELGRATSNEDGVAIAWAISEFLLVKRAMTFFVTHYPQLCRMATIYPNVQNQHLGAICENSSNEIMYTHKIMPGPCRMSADYGVDMASTCGWETDIVELARNIRNEVESKLPDGLLCAATHVNNLNVSRTMEVRNKAESVLNDLVKHLVALKASEGRLNEGARRSYLQDLRDQFVTTDDENLLQMIKKLLLDDNETNSPKLPLHPEGLHTIKRELTASNLCLITRNGMNTTKDTFDNNDTARDNAHSVQTNSQATAKAHISGNKDILLDEAANDDINKAKNEANQTDSKVIIANNTHQCKSLTKDITFCDTNHVKMDEQTLYYEPMHASHSTSLYTNLDQPTSQGLVANNVADCYKSTAQNNELPHLTKGIIKQDKQQQHESTYDSHLMMHPDHRHKKYYTYAKGHCSSDVRNYEDKNDNCNASSDDSSTESSCESSSGSSCSSSSSETCTSNSSDSAAIIEHRY